MVNILRVLSHHKLLVIMSLFLAIFSSIFGGLSLATLSPLLAAIFGLENTSDQGFIWKILTTPVKNLDPYKGVILIGLILVMLIILKNLFLYLNKLLASILEEKIQKDLRDQIFEKILNSPVYVIEKLTPSEIISRILSDISQVKIVITQGIFVYMREILNMIAYLTVAIWASLHLTVYALFIVPFFSILIVYIGKKVKKRSERVQDDTARVSKRLTEALYGIRILKSYTVEKREFERFKFETKNLLRSSIRRAYVSNMGSHVTEALSSLGIFLILLVGAHLIFELKSLNPDRFIVFLAAAVSLLSPFKNIIQAHTVFQQGLGSAEKLLRIAGSLTRERTGRVIFNGLRDSLDFCSVSFSYSDSRIPALKEVTFSIKKGEKVALVGPSGAGKSTVLLLILRFYEPTRGRILVDGRDLSEYDVYSYRKKIAYVPQDTFLFSGSILDNLLLANPDATVEEIEEALRIAKIYDFVKRLPHGLNTPVDEKGINFSGGEKQRFFIARAILRNPEIVLFDEPTSNIDPRTEKELNELIWRFLENKTCIIIAHKFQTIKNVDKIIYLEDGVVKGIGTHEDLMRTCPGYQKLFESYFFAQTSRL